jgi:hypothetical protein
MLCSNYEKEGIIIFKNEKNKRKEEKRKKKRIIIVRRLPEIVFTSKYFYR